MSVLGGNGEGPGKFYRPEGVQVDGANVRLSDTGNGSIARYRSVE